MRTIQLTNLPVVALVDDADYEALNSQTWFGRITHSGTYVFSTRKGHKVKLHHCVLERMGLPRPRPSQAHLADHKDGNPLNNQRSNLRWATRSQNCINRTAHKGTKTGVIGVYFRRGVSRKFFASITINRTVIPLGHHSTLEEAASVRAKAAKRFHGEFTRIQKQTSPLTDDDLAVFRKRPLAKTGHIGVHRQPNGRFIALVWIPKQRKTISLGTFSTAIKAANARKLAVEKLGL